MQTLSSSPNFQEQTNRFSRNNAIAFSISICLIFCIAPVNSIRADVNKNQSNFQDLTKTIQAGEWLELPGNISEVFVDKEKTQGNGDTVGPIAVLTAWNGAAWDDNCGYFLGGGHADYGGNEVYSYCWGGQKAFQWQVLMPPSKSDPDDNSKCPHPKEGPRAYHTYDGVIYLPITKSIFIWGTVGFCLGDMMGSDEVAELILEPTPKWKLHPKAAPLKGFAHTAFNDKNGKVYIWEGSRQAYIVDPKTLDYRASGESTADYGGGANMIYDRDRNVLWAITGLALFQFVLSPEGEVLQFKQIVDAKQYPAGLTGSDGLALRKGKLYFWSGNNSVIKYDPDNNKWSTYLPKNGPTRVSSNGIFSKWHYVEKQDVFLGVSNHKQGMWVWKPSEGEGQLDTRQIKQCKAGVKTCTEHKSIDAALADINAGSRLSFSAGYYNDSAIVAEKNLTLIGSPEVLIQGITSGKATFVAVGDDLYFENFDITLPVGAAQANEACFRGEGKNLTLKKIYCHDMQMGVIGGSGTLTIEQSRFEDSGLNGNADLGHMVYACSNDECPEGSLIIRDSKFTRMGINKPGHAIKSRAPKNLIENVVISGLDAHSGRAIDIPQGGDTIIRNSVMQIGANGDNEDFIAIGLESKKFPLHENTKTLIENVIAICDLKEPCDFVRYLGPEPILKNVVLIGQFSFYDDLYPISRDGIKIYRDRAEAGLKPYPYVPEKWVQIKPH